MFQTNAVRGVHYEFHKSGRPWGAPGHATNIARTFRAPVQLVCESTELPYLLVLFQEQQKTNVNELRNSFAHFLPITAVRSASP